MTRVFLRPDAATLENNNGIGRVVHAQARYLPQFGIELVGSPDSADVMAGHTHDHGVGRIDVCHVHGLYWTGDRGSGEYTPWHTEANTRIIASVRRARAVTVPSEWVAEPFRRDMRIRPAVIGHGIELDEWSPGVNGGYVLWNKNRGSTDVCDPTPAWDLARRGLSVVSTFLPKGKDRPDSMRVTGAMKAEPMKELVRNADIYLATTKETFGIGTLEAMACGVPVVGYAWGGTADIVRHGENGLLVQPGDVEGLVRAIEEARRNRQSLGAGARETAARYTWPKVIEQYANLYHELARSPEPSGVAVVVTSHNYAQWLGECIESVLAQTYRVDQVIVVDDGSTDRSREVAARYVDRGVQLVTQANQGVAAARNHGIAITRQPFVMCLDADDKLDPRYVATCRAALMADRGLGLAWTGMSVLREGRAPSPNAWTGTFDWEWQATPGNPPRTCVPTAAMFRRALWERGGPYKQEHAPGEDAEFYTRGLSVGFAARQVTDSPWMIYRDHGHGAHRVKAYKPIDTWHPWMRDREYPLGAPSLVAPTVRSYSRPAVSIIIPVGCGHARYLPDALESVLGQSMREWEVIVVDDSDDDIDAALRPFPFVRYLDTKTVGDGPGRARNRGLLVAKAPLVLFLDADDQLAPGALAALCRAYAASEGRYVYGDWQAMGESVPVREADYDPGAWLDFRNLGGKHAVTVLMATADARRLLFDEQLSAWEDWDFFARAAIAGVWGKRADAVTLYVRRDPEGRTGRAFQSPNGIIGALASRYRESEMAKKSCCGGNGDAIMAAKEAWEGVPEERAGGLSVRRTATGRGATPSLDAGAVQPIRMEFTGRRSGAVTYHGARGAGRDYRGGNNAVHRYANVHPADVGDLESTGDWRRVAPALTMPEVVAQAVTPSPAKVQLTSGSEPVAVAEIVPAETVQVIQTADGPVRRKRGTGKKAAGSRELKDLPPIE